MADLPTIRQRITLGVAPTIDEARALVAETGVAKAINVQL